MSEAQNDNGKALPDSTAGIDTSEETIVDLAELADETESDDRPEKLQTEYRVPTPELEPEDIRTVLEDIVDSDREIAEALAWQSDADVLELVALSEALREQNTELIEHTEELENLLDECHNALQAQIERTQVAETKLVEQTNQLKVTQEQLTRLFRELESSHQVAQRQQILIETLNDQLQSSQERVAQLERQCALTQQRYNEQSQLLMQRETACRELQDRLQRQQRYTLQFKAALDKCLDMPGIKEFSGSTSSPALPAVAESNHENTLEFQRLVLKPQPIQPWSAELESDDRDIAAEDTELGYLTTHPGARAELPSADIISSIADEEEIDIDTEEETIINPFFSAAESNLSLASNLPTSPASDSTLDINKTEVELWQELERLTQDTVLPENAALAGDRVAPEAYANYIPPLHDAIASGSESGEDGPKQEEESIAKAATSDSSITPAVPALAGNESIAQAPNWPSPVVYPQRHPKKIKSLAAIDLPSFPRIKKA
ncbi:hypothetical protein H6S82_25560 [Planktothrix sp. FACHB-1355]|uniref:Uncharacterized protein n=1 Tax=Aerosakkonema funiforme FACHB-1375 TaxID=2949571 RepID=A0A926ZFM3_9CYAN|nr:MULTISPECIES: hypothetical protein [Oscillatoriales]MBD2180232.1 hypothetical protein [Aerosakkonema funiforme FACHB-1375]MBD3562186.1 hypothetical protein [Planktothrix sp. FACHB-1355]